jgi:hypothetical protein
MQDVNKMTNLDWLISILSEYANANGFAEVRVTIQAGEIVNVKDERNRKPPRKGK